MRGKTTSENDSRSPLHLNGQGAKPARVTDTGRQRLLESFSRIPRSPDEADAPSCRNPKGQAIFRPMASSLGPEKGYKYLLCAAPRGPTGKRYLYPFSGTPSTPRAASECGLSRPREFLDTLLASAPPERVEDWRQRIERPTFNIQRPTSN